LLGLLPPSLKLMLERRYCVQATTTARQPLRCEYILGLITCGLIVPQIIFDDVFGFGPLLAPTVNLARLIDFFVRCDRLADPNSLQ
jgi:hypothetical protein